MKQKPIVISEAGFDPKRIKCAEVRKELSDARALNLMLAQLTPLTREQKVTIVSQAITVLEQNYVHMPLKRAMHAVDPVQRLKLLLHQTRSSEGANGDSDFAFHSELTEIFTSLRDMHTNYLLPDPFRRITAFLGFMVEDYFDNGVRKYVVSGVSEAFVHPTFVRGVEILYWNGAPIERAVRQQGQRYAGSNSAARHARGVQTLTTRALLLALPPDEEFVDIKYRTAAGVEHEVRVTWLGTTSQSGGIAPDSSSSALTLALGIDLQQQIEQRTRASLFAPQARILKDKARDKLANGQALDPLESSMPHVLQASVVETTSGKFGYIRIRTFRADPDSFVNEFIRLMRALPNRGLIIDVRGNGGGYIMSGEYLLQLFTPRRIEPEPVQFLNSALNLDICKRNGADSRLADLTGWTTSMNDALQTGSTFSAGFPISDPEKCNAIGQRYFGPVALITDALCYSTTDIFAAGFHDHNIGVVVGTDANTGAGGANVWTYEHLRLATSAAESTYVELPADIGFRVSMRRTLRVGKLAGTPLEDLGVAIPTEKQHRLTKQDILGDKANQDLKNFVGSLLKDAPARALSVRALQADERHATLDIKVTRMSRIDVYVNERPVHSRDVKESSVEVEVTSQTQDDTIELKGFDGDTLVARYRVTWREIMQSAPQPKPAARKGAKKKTSFTDQVRSRVEPMAPEFGDDFYAASEPALGLFGGAALEPGPPPTPVAAWRTALSLKKLFAQVNLLAPTRKKTSDGTIGDAKHQTSNSDHNPWVVDAGVGVVTACDITHDPSGGCDAEKIAESIRMSKDVRVKYIIWNERIANSASIGGNLPWAWRKYSGANKHNHHIHISVKPEKAQYDSEASWTL